MMIIILDKQPVELPESIAGPIRALWLAYNGWKAEAEKATNVERARCLTHLIQVLNDLKLPLESSDNGYSGTIYVLRKLKSAIESGAAADNAAGEQETKP